MLDISLGSWWIYISIGLLAGVLSGLLGLGSGILLVPALVFLCHLPQKTAQGAALTVMVPMVLVGAIRYKLSSGTSIDYSLVAVLAIGAVIGSLIGSEIALRSPAHMLRRAFAILVFMVAIKMFFTRAKPAIASPDPSPNIERTDDHDHR